MESHIGDQKSKKRNLSLNHFCRIATLGSPLELPMGSSFSSQSQLVGSTSLDQFVPSTLLEPPREPNLILKALIQDVWSYLFKFLTHQDLVSFMSTSSQAHDAVLSFVGHSISKLHHDPIVKLEMLLSDDSMPLLLPEKQIRHKLVKLRESGVRNPTLVHLKAADMFLCKGGEIRLRRECVYNADNFPHLDQPQQHIVSPWNDTLNRKCVVLNMVCWLFFDKAFYNVTQGHYEISLRIRLGKRLNWGFLGGVENTCPAILSAKLKVEGDLPMTLSSCSFAPQVWVQIQKRQIEPCKLNGARVLFDPLSDWFWLTLPPFKVEGSRPSTVLFEFKDIENPWWKQGMEWDFIQLKRLN